MNTKTIQSTRPLAGVVGLVAALLVAGVLTNVTLAMGISDRVAFVALVVVGMTMCALGGIGQAPVHGWGHPISITGYVLGALALLLAAAVLVGVPMPWITTERAALIALTALMLVKVGMAQLYPR
jgi:hypothetical protein